ncbi:hypothetical protein CAOG_00083 [Capsaspora owczarzaki ATCC 30864]|uniref:Major facilitator superfamily (MFS) profile domain-containing protein n=1 Tax=Capsaspora owczarzaki (strain ATCC 30864) TaxID=595528 RepID=A0A0D2WGB0_CAPO3|nr:hypothetical protein CAOG_00083 [Capsaspora owczarzaki ATCC 30864]KJE88425.1 hypothetical protein CAOG_000083 [Capsaspora owczarzaki ATCC 30864]|eukprot:XP_004364954.1 hypothetical protein CAOG_00083 [Capsaspora owczarzaki ATCC 30864]
MNSSHSHSTSHTNSTRVTVLRWVSLLAGFAIMVMSGTLYGISAYSPEIKSRLNYTEPDINLITSIADVGLYVSIPAGLVYDRFGFRVAASIGAVMIGLGYLLMYIAVWQDLAPSKAPLMGAILALVGQGGIFGVIAAMAANERNYRPRDKGKVAGFLFAGFGSSAAIFSAVYKLAYQNSADLEGYFILLACTTAAICLVCGLFLLRHLPQDEMLYPSDTEKDGSKAALLGDERPVPGYSNNKSVNPSSILLASATHADLLKRPDLTPLEVLRTKLFVLIFSVIMISVGAALLFINNLGSIYEAYGGQHGESGNLVIVFSVLNVVSRVIFGYLSDHFSRHLSRASFLTMAVVIVTGAQLLLAWSTVDLLYLAAVLVGLADGGIFSQYAVLVRESFGAKHYGTNFGLATMAAGVGVFLFGPMSAALYDDKIVGDGNNCYGESCYQTSFFISAGCCAFSLLLCVQMIRETRKIHLERWI